MKKITFVCLSCLQKANVIMINCITHVLHVNFFTIFSLTKFRMNEMICEINAVGVVAEPTHPEGVTVLKIAKDQCFV